MNPMQSGAGGQGARPYCFDDIVVDPAAHSLLRAGIAQSVEPKAFTVLITLLERPGELIARDDLLDQVWGHRHVTPGVLTRAIAQLRHALGDDSHQPRYILTRHALGYCFIGDIRNASGARLAVPSADAAQVPPCAGEDVASPAGPDADQNATGSSWQDIPESEPAGPDAASPGAANGGAAHPAGRLAWIFAAMGALTIVVIGWVLRYGAFAPRAPAPTKPAAASIAVMPFTSLGKDHGEDYFAQGLAEEMRDALAGVKGLKVAASISPAMRKDAPDAKVLGERLGVATILDATVRREGQRIRITARLSDAATGFTLWSRTYDRELKGVFDTQSEIAGEVLHSLLGAMPAERAGLKKRLTPTHDEAAFDAYLQGLQLIDHVAQPADADAAIAHFDQALTRDSGFARAQAKICRTEIWQFENARNAGAFDRAMAACRRAAQMDPTLAEVNLALGDLYRVNGDFERALQCYLDSGRSPSVRALAHIGMAKVYVAQGKSARAIQEFGTALEMSPGDARVYAQIGYQQYVTGDITHALESYRKVVGLRPDDAEGWSILGALYLEAGDSTASAQALGRAISIAPDAASLTNLGLIKYQAGDYAAAVDLRRRAIALAPQDFLMWANLGEALRADPANGAAVQAAYRKAADYAVRYLKLKPDDAAGSASLGLYRAILGDKPGALDMVRRSETLSSEPGEVALLNAQTLGILGNLPQARLRLSRARAAGVPELQITSNLTFRRLGLLSAPGDEVQEAHGSPAPSKPEGHSPGG